jgi:hypothetical protein
VAIAKGFRAITQRGTTFHGPTNASAVSDRPEKLHPMTGVGRRSRGRRSPMLTILLDAAAALAIGAPLAALTDGSR